MKSMQFRLGVAAVLCAAVIAALLLAFPATTNAAPKPDSGAHAVQESSNFCTVRVQRGEALYMIAARYRTTTAYLASINNLYNPNYIYAGMVLKVPCAPHPQPQPLPYPQPQPHPQPQPGYPICAYYTVQRGDWLKTIAYRYGLTWQQLAQVNGLSNPNYIYAGQKLAIPCAHPYPPPVCPGCPPCQGCPPPVYPTPPPVCPGCPPCQGCPPPVYPTPPPPECPGCPPCQGCPPITAVPPLLNIVSMRDDYYEPAVITVRVGSFVQWVNQGKNQHTVTQGLCPNGFCTPTPGGFNSGVLNPGQASGFVFNQLGTFAYFCQIHGAKMTASVAVTP